jgi:V8-like Glu-specific endopeptidase
LIADDLFLTAGHCLSPFPPDPDWVVPRIDGSDKPIPNTEIATNMRVEFNYQLDPDGNDREPERFAVVELVEYDYSLDVDYAIVRLEGAPGEHFGTTPIAKRDVALGSSLCIIGHPQGLAKRVAAGTASEYRRNRLFYRDLDTAGGSSGSGILASPEGPLVGVHTAGGCLETQTGSNHGVPISLLLAASATLKNLRCAW